MKKNISALTLALMLGVASLRAQAPQNTPLIGSEAQTLPISQVTVFKDGHSLVVRKGEVEFSPDGTATINTEAQPLLGTFWPFIEGDDARLVYAKTSEAHKANSAEATTIAQLLMANKGSMTVLSKINREGEQSSFELTGKITDDFGDTLVFQEDNADSTVHFIKIEDITSARPFDSPWGTKYMVEDGLKNFSLNYKIESKQKKATVGFSSVQKGIRWFPSYKLSLQRDGKATLNFNATIVNDFGSLSGSEVNLVIGVPNLIFADSLDPMFIFKQDKSITNPGNDYSLQNWHLNPNLTMNSLHGISQISSYPGSYRGNSSGTPKNENSMLDGEAVDDLFYYTLKDVDLAMGERIVTQIGTMDLPYEDVFTLEIGMMPPKELLAISNNNQTNEQLAQLLDLPQVMRTLRLTNKSGAPLTTAPVSTFNEDGFLGQALLTYCPPGAPVDIPINTALDIAVANEDTETNRKFNAVKINHYNYQRITMEGETTLTNRRGTPVSLEVTRYISADTFEAPGAKTRGVDPLSVTTKVEKSNWRWPQWWNETNSAVEMKWDMELEPGESKTLRYTWSYLSRH